MIPAFVRDAAMAFAWVYPGQRLPSRRPSSSLSSQERSLSSRPFDSLRFPTDCSPRNVASWSYLPRNGKPWTDWRL